MSQTRPGEGIQGGGSSRGESESESGADHFDAALKALHECKVMDRVHVERVAAHTEGDHRQERASSSTSSTASVATVGLLSSGSLISVMPTPFSPRDEIPPLLASRPRYLQNEASPRPPPPYNPFIEDADGVAQQSQDDGNDGRTDGASAMPSYNPFIELAGGVAQQLQDAGSDGRRDGASARPSSAPAGPAPASATATATGTGTAELLPQRRHSPAAVRLPAASVATAAVGTVPGTVPVAPWSPPALTPATLPPPPSALSSAAFQPPPPALRPGTIPPPSAGLRPVTLPGSTAARCRPILWLAVENAQVLTPTQTATPGAAAAVADDPTPEEAQAIIDAAEMEEALAVVRAAEAVENAAQVAAGESMAAAIQAEEQRAGGNGRTGGTAARPAQSTSAIARVLVDLAADEAMAAALHAEEMAGASTSSPRGRRGSANASVVAARASVPAWSGTDLFGLPSRRFPARSYADQRHGNSPDNSNAARPLETSLPRWWQPSVSSPRSIQYDEATVRAREEAEDAAAIAALYSDGEDEECRQVEVDGATQAEAEVFNQASAMTKMVASTTPVQREQRESRVSGIPRCSKCQSRTSGSSDVSKCRNCCMLVCDQCVGALWARNMVPSENVHNSDSHRMRVCRTCHTAMEAFRKALLLGKEEDATEAYRTGFVNVNTPYTIYHGEWPVHCAAAGGKVKLLSWLVDDLGCSLFFSDTQNKIPLRDQRQLTVLGAAAVHGQVQTMRYLVGKGCCVSEIEHLPTLKRALKACLLGSTEGEGPVERAGADGDGNPGGVHGGFVFGSGVVPVDDDSDLCIVCFDNERNCTLVPCGHHCACLSCAARFNECPICRAPVQQKIKTINV